jgi:MFS family permease
MATEPMTGASSIEAAGPAARARVGLSRDAGFWLVGTILVLMLFSSSVPSPMYVIYQQRWQMSATMITVVFAIYAVAVLFALLVFGSLSDQIGRRPVLLVSIGLVVISMAIFAGAQGVSWLLVARAVQGLGVGLATGAMSAALVELAPPNAPGRGTLVNGVGPTLGMALGALIAGLLVQYAPAPTVLSYLVLLGAFVLTAVGVRFMPETAQHTGPVRIRPRRISVPQASRRAFALLSLALIAVWAVGGFYLSLGPSLAVDVLHSTNHLIGGLTVAVLAGVASIGQVALGKTVPTRTALIGLVSLLVGLALLLVTLATESAVVFFVGTAVLGAGWGTTFLGAFRLLAGLAEPARRGELMAAVYVVAYLAMSVPVVVAGLITSHLGLHQTATIFIIAVAAVCAVALAGLRWAKARTA